MTTMTETGKPWYREPWPWILMAGPAMVVLAGIATAWLAISTDDGLVEDDYYKNGLSINQTLERDRAARALHIQARLMAGDAPGQVRLLLQPGDAGSAPGQLRLRVLHPTRAGMDQEVVLARQGDLFYAGALKPLPESKWRLILEDMDGSWRLSGVWRVPRDNSVTLSAGNAGDGVGVEGERGLAGQ